MASALLTSLLPLLLPLQLVLGAGADAALQLYVKKGDEFVPLGGDYAVVPLRRHAGHSSTGAEWESLVKTSEHRKSHVASGFAARRRRALAAEPAEPETEGYGCTITTTEVKVHRGRCRTVGGLVPACYTDPGSGGDHRLVNFFSKECRPTLQLPMFHFDGASEIRNERRNDSDSSRLGSAPEQLQSLFDLASARKRPSTHSTPFPAAAAAAAAPAAAAAAAARPNRRVTTARASQRQLIP